MSTFWSMIAVAGLWGFLICTMTLIWKGFPARGIFDAPRALRWGIGVLVSFIVWIVGMTQA